MAWDKGQKTKSSVLWLAREDVLALSDAVAQICPGIVWQSRQGADAANSTQDHPDLQSALNHSLGEQNRFVGQAGALLPVGMNKTLGLLLFNYSARYPETIVPARDFGAADVSAYPAQFTSVRSSSLAIRWNVTDEDAEVCAAIKQQVAQIWKALNQVTLPVKCRWLINGLDASSARYRIGQHMNDLVRRDGWCLQDGQFLVLD